MRVAVATFTFNESFNLPIWIAHYGAEFGPENLFVVDRGSDDGSVDALAGVNLIRVPRKKFDEFEKTNFFNNFQNALLSFYDVVIVTDCDELLFADPLHAGSLRELIVTMPGEYATALGFDIVHMINHEDEIDPGKKLLSQRGVARFASPECKTIVSKTPLKWLPGFHSANKPPQFLPGLYLAHTKLVDFTAAFKRQKINLATEWSAASLDANFGAHHRYGLQKFVHQSFWVPIDLENKGQVGDFDVTVEAELFISKVKLANGFYYVPMDIAKYVRIPERFKPCV